MSGIAIIVQARMSSTRLPRKSLKLIGRKPLIWFVIDRLRSTGLPVKVCTSIDPTDDLLAEYLEEEKVSYYRGDLQNVLQRYINTAEEFGIDKIVRVTGDNPFIDTKALGASLTLFDNYNYVDGIYQEHGFIKGTGFELVTLNELKSIESDQQEHLEHVTTALREKISGNSKYLSLKPPEYHSFREGIFLSCDYPEDLELIRILLKSYNFQTTVPVQDIIKTYEKNPELFQPNAVLHQ